MPTETKVSTPESPPKMWLQWPRDDARGNAAEADPGRREPLASMEPRDDARGNGWLATAGLPALSVRLCERPCLATAPLPSSLAEEVSHSVL